MFKISTICFNGCLEKNLNKKQKQRDRNTTRHFRIYAYKNLLVCFDYLLKFVGVFHSQHVYGVGQFQVTLEINLNIVKIYGVKF